MTSRRKFVITAGAAGVAAGLGAGLWRMRESDAATNPGPLWEQIFQTPQGQSLALTLFKGKPLLLNFWATWCPPCVEEFPLLDAFFRERQANGWQVIGLAIDQPSSVRKFLTHTPVTFPIGLAGLGGTELAKSLGNEAGGLPFSVVLGPDGNIRQRRMGRVSPADLQQWAAA